MSTTSKMVFKNNTMNSIKKKDTDQQNKKKDYTAPNIVEIDGLCSMLNIGKNTAYNLLTSGEIDSFKVGSVWKIPVSSINDYIERKCRETKLIKMYSLVNKNRDLFYEKHGYIPISSKI